MINAGANCIFFSVLHGQEWREEYYSHVSRRLRACDIQDLFAWCVNWKSLLASVLVVDCTTPHMYNGRQLIPTAFPQLRSPFTFTTGKGLPDSLTKCTTSLQSISFGSFSLELLSLVGRHASYFFMTVSKRLKVAILSSLCYCHTT